MAGTGDETACPRTYNLGMSLTAFIYDISLAISERRGMAARRGELLASARGRVLELGAGTGLNLRHYPDDVDLVVSEPDPGMRARLKRRAGRDVTVVDAGAESLPFPDDSFDTVVSTLVLCTVAHPDAALAEVRRVLAPEGVLAFYEHVRSPRAPFRAVQHSLDALFWTRALGGCRTTRDTEAAIRVAGFEPESIERGFQSSSLLTITAAPYILGVARTVGV